MSVRRRIGWLAVVAVLGCSGCDRGDYLGPVERTARSLSNGWDMWANESVRPYEQPMVQPVDGTVPVGGVSSDMEAGRAGIGEMPDAEKLRRGQIVYRRYCHHCHGVNGDGRIIVGESFSPALPDLRSQVVQNRTDAEMYRFLMEGSPRMISLADTVTPVDAVLVIDYVRTLQTRPSVPYYPPQYTTAPPTR